MDSLIEKELAEIEEFVTSLGPSLIVTRDGRQIEIISDDIDGFHERMCERFDTDDAATVSVVGDGDITNVYDVPDRNAHLMIVVIEVRETRSERGLRPEVTAADELRPLNGEEIQNIDEQLRNSDLHTAGLTKELYEDLQRFQVPDFED